MKKSAVILLTALIAISAFSGCGSKNQDYDHDDSTRILYDENDSESQVGEDQEDIEDEESEFKNEENKKEDSSSELNGRRTDEESKKSTSSNNGTIVSTAKSNAKTSSGSASSNTAATSSKSGVIYYVSTKPSKVGSKTSSSSYSSVLSTASEQSSDTDTSSDNRWYDSENDDTDSDIIDIINTDIDTDTDTEDDIIKGSLDYSDLSFPIRGTSISVGDSYSEADELLGESYELLGSIVYNECSIQISGEEGYEVITKIIINSPTVTIAKGIHVGSTKRDLLEAFGDPSYDNVYEIGNQSLEFVMINDMVAEIIYE